MDEKYIKDLYNGLGGKEVFGEYNDFKSMITTDEKYAKDVYSSLGGEQVFGKYEDYSGLIGFKKKDDTELPSGDGLSESAKSKSIDETPKEKPFFQGTMRTILEGMDSPTNTFGVLGIGDLIDDIGRAIDTGLKQGAIVTPANQVLLSGKGSDPETIKKLIEAAKTSQAGDVSDEMMSFSKEYEEGGKDLFAFMKAIVKNPGILPEIIVSSFSGLINPSSIGSGATVTGGAAAGGALFGGAGSGPAALASLPYAMGAANMTMESGLTFAELLQEEIEKRGLEFNEEGVRSILENEDLLSEIRTKAVARGVTIGVIDAITGRIAGRVGAKLAGNSSAAKIKSGLSATGIEMAGGSTGEAAGRLAAGQEMDIAEIGLEGIAEGPMSAISLASELGRKPTYKINGAVVSESDLKEIVDKASGKELLAMNIDIKNDKAGYTDIIQDKIDRYQLSEEIKSVYPDLGDELIEQLIELEKELKSLEGKKTQVAKDRAAQIKEQIKSIEEAVPAPKTDSPTYSIDGVSMDREKTSKAIKEADSIESLNDIEVKNDPELEQKLKDKKDSYKRTDEAKVDSVEEETTQEELSDDAKKISELTKEAKEKDPENYWSVDEVTPEQASEGTIVSVEDGEAMGIVSKDGDIKGVVKKPESKKKGLAQKILQKAVEAGGIKLDNFDGYLTKIYEKAGFRVVSRTPFNEEFAPEGWNKEKHGAPDVVAMVYDPEGKLNIEEKTFDSYDDALAYRDSFTDQAKKSYPTSKDKSLLNMTGKSVTVKIGGKNVSGVIDVDEGGKVTLNRGKEVFEISPDTEFTEFQRPVNVDQEGNFEYKGEKFPEARVVTEDGKKKAAFVRSDGSVVAVTNPSIVEEVEYQISLSDTETVNQKIAGETVPVTSSPGMAEKIAKAIQAAAKTIKSSFPNVNLVVGKNLQDTKAKLEAALTPIVGQEKARAIAAGFNNDRGSAIFVNGKPVAIAINEEAAEATTAAHEIWHMLLREAFGNNPKKFQEFRNAISNELINNGFEDVAAYLDEFSAEYDGEVSFEEYLAELGGQLSSGNIDLSNLSPAEKSLFQRIKDIINKFARQLTGKEVFLNDATPDNILQFMIDISGMIERGEDISGVTRKTEIKEKGVSVKKQKQLPARIDNEINDIIAKGKADNKKPGQIAKEALKYVKSTDAFAKLSDRDKIKVIDQTKRLAGMRVQSKVDEYAALKDQIRLEARAAREAAGTSKKAFKTLAAQVRSMIGKGLVTQYRASAIIKKLSTTNFYSEASINDTLDYISEVFDKSNLAFKIARAGDLLKPAKNALKTKIGQAKELYPVLKTLFSFDPAMVPIDQIDDYLEILDTFGVRKAVLELNQAGEYMAKAENILNAIAEQQEGIIQETENTEALKDPAEEEARGKSVVKEINKKDLDTSLITDQDDKKIADRFKKLTKSDVNSLVGTNPDGTNNYSQIYKLQQIMDNIENGYIPHQAALMIAEIEANRSSAQITPIIQKVSAKSIALGATRAIGKIKSLLTSRSSILEQIRSSPLEFIDDIMGNFNSRTIYNNTFGRLASAKGVLDADMQIVSAKLNAAERLVQSGKSDNAAVASKYKIMAYLLQREFNANPGEKSVAPAIDFIDKTIAAHRAGDLQLGSKDIQILEDIKRQFSEVDSEGKTQISQDKIESSLTANEKKAIALIDDANQSLAGKALFTSAVIRGSRVNMVNNYIHHEVQGGTAAQRIKAIEDKILAGFGGRPSTKAGTLNERTPGAKAINFDPITATYMGAKMTLTDYHMTQPIREVMKTVNKIKQAIVDNPDSTKTQIEAANALIEALEETVSTTFQNAFTEYSILENVIAEVRKQGYFQTLASIPRALAELGSNLVYTLKSPGLLMDGFTKFGDMANYGDGILVMRNLNSEVATRLYGNELLTGKFAEGGMFSGLNTGGSAKSKNDVFNAISFIHKLTTRRVKNANDMIADYLLSTPDKVLSRPMYFAAFSQEFEKITGRKITASDFKKIGEGKSDLLSQDNAEAMEKARIFADRTITTMSASSNSFNSILKNVPRKSDSAVNSVLRAANSFMSRFYLTEYAVLRSATLSLFHSGELNKKQALVTMGAVAMRMASYMVLYQALKNVFDIAMAQALGLEEPEEMDEEDIMNDAVRSFVGTAVNTMSRRMMGNIAYMPLAWATETLNEKYGAGLRNDEEYDPYEHSLVFSGVSKEDLKNKAPVEVVAKAIAGPYSPMVNTASRTLVLYNRMNKETAKPETKQRAIDELTTRMALEAAGQVGIVPLYKDIRRIVINDLFADIDKPKQKSSSITKKDVEEMRKIDPETAKLMEEIRKMQK